MSPDSSTIRVASWNVRDLTGDPVAVRAVLRALAADVVCLQEAPRRPGGVLLRTTALAHACRLRHVVGGRRSGGTAILVGARTRVEASAEVRLPIGRWYERRRGVAVAAVAVRDTRLAVASAHLPLDPDRRALHARMIRDRLWTGPPQRVADLVAAGAAVIGADLNEPPPSPVWGLLGAVAGDAAQRRDATAVTATFPARAPDLRLDVVLVADALEVVDYGDGGVDPDLVARASDHRPVLGVLRPR